MIRPSPYPPRINRLQLHFGRGVLLAASIALTACVTPPTAQEPSAVKSAASAAPVAPAIQAPALQPAPSLNQPASVQQVFLTDPLAPSTVDLTVPPRDIWQRIRNGFAVPNIDTPLVAEWQTYYAARPEYVQRMTERASLYLFHIVEELERRGMPTEIALLPFIESAYNPTALSRAQAAGMWQFIPSTGRLYQLKQDGWRDERRDVIASTNAALDYLTRIFEMHGDWHLALASYNWGEGAVKRAIEKNRARGLPGDYLSLDMPKETRNYIPKLQAIKNIVANPQAFNLMLPPIGNQAYFGTVQKTRDIDVETAARLAEMPLADFKALNPSFKRPMILGAQTATILLPTGKVEIFHRNLAQARGPLSRWAIYTFQRSDRIERVAKKHGITVASLKNVNNIGRREKIAPGMVLLVPRRNNSKESNEILATAAPTATHARAIPDYRAANIILTPDYAPAAAGPAAKELTHTVKPGETMYSISRQYDVAIPDIQQWNKLNDFKVNVGQKLLIKREMEIAQKE